MTVRAQTFSLHGAGLSLETDHPGFADYAGRFLAGLLPAAEGAPAVEARLHWDSRPPAAWDGSGVRRWGRRLGQLDDRLLLTEVQPAPGLQIAARWVGGSLELEAYFRPRGALKRLGLRLDWGKDALFSALVYYLVYFPLFHYFEQRRGWRLLHAAAVARPDGDWLLAGLPGSGKTTFALSLLAQPGVQLLSDNLLLSDGQTVYAVPEPVHLSAASLELLPLAVREQLRATGRGFSYQRAELRLEADGERRWQAHPQALFFLGLSDRPACRPLDPVEAERRLEAFDLQARELQAAAQFSAALQLIAPQGLNAGETPTPQRGFRRRSPNGAQPAYELWLAPGQDLQAAYELATHRVQEGAKLGAG